MSPVARKKSPPPSRAGQDLELVRAIMSGSVESWHAFVDRFTGLIMSVLRKQLFVEDNDDIQTVYVDVLKDLYDNKLREYAGKASLATWLVLVTRGKAVDFLRSKRGRRQLPRGYDRLRPFDQRVFTLHFVEGLGYEALLQTIGAEGQNNVEDVVAAVGRIVDNVDGRHLKRLDYENDARRRGVPAGGLMAHLYRAEVELWGSGSVKTPDQVMADADRGRAIERLGELTAKLDKGDRKLLALRFEEGLTARKISERLGMDGQRSVYTAINRALRQLRCLFLSDTPDAEAISEDFSAEIRGSDR